MVDQAELQAMLKALSDNYAAQLPGKLDQIRQAWNELPRDTWDDEAFQTLHRMVHSLTGSGKTFGFALLSDVARNLEGFLKQCAQARKALSKDQCNDVQVLLSELQQVSAFRDVSEIAEIKDVARSFRKVDNKHIVLVEDDAELAESLKIQLNYFGYEVSTFSSLKDFCDGIPESDDFVVLMDVCFPEDSMGGIHVMKEVQQKRSVQLTVIFLTAHDEFEVRLEAVRAGGVAYLSKPVNIGNLIDKLDSLTSTMPPSPYRILIVDDSEAITTYYSAVLELAGMTVKAVNELSKVIYQLFEFNPDLILLDIYMPGCNGMELARVIRQLDAFVSIPIVFLSAEGNLDKQLFAMGLGGDDFLTKPILPQHLIASVSSRVRRSLHLRSFMVRDSLTGLLNHTAIKDHLSREVARARRQGTPLSFVMVDIDHFKNVNDTYGHPAGDRVILSISRMLKQRLRETDIVGRYGGEEFAVVMCDTDGASALRVMDAIRRDFSQLRHLADEKEFSTTFSYGVAAQLVDPSKICEAADKALYQAKHAGRNQGMLADAESA